MPEEQKEFVRAMLVKAGFPSQDIGWMVHTCPSLETARRLYPAIVAEVER